MLKKSLSLSLVMRAILVGVILTSALIILAIVAIRGFQSTITQLDEITHRSSPLKSVVSEIQVSLLQANLAVNQFAQSTDAQKQELYRSRFDAWRSQNISAGEKLALYSDDTAMNGKVLDLTRESFEEALEFMDVIRHEQQLYAQLNELMFRREEILASYSVESKDILDYLQDEPSKLGARLASGRFTERAETLFERSAMSLQEETSAAVLEHDGKIEEVYREWVDSWPVIKEAVEFLGMTMDELIIQSEPLFTGDNSIQKVRAQYLDSLVLHADSIAELQRLETNANSLMTELVSLADQLQLQAETETLNVLATSQTVITVLGIIAIVVACLVIWNLVVGIKRPITEIQDGLHRISEGDMSLRLKESGGSELVDIVRSVNRLSESLSDILGKVSTGARTMSQSTTQAQEINAKTTKQVNEQLEETQAVATAVSEMEAAIAQVSSSAEEASAEVRHANKAAAENKTLMDSNVEAIQELDSQLNQAALKMQELKESSESIEKIMEVIQSIAEQTNLLALNAAIEAARAGEQGRGFAVVADEVRSLAKRTQDATQEISSMIETLQANSTDAADMMLRSQTNAQNSVTKATEAGEALDSMVQNLTTIDEMSMSIASAAEQQTAVAQEVSKNIVRIADLGSYSAEDVREANEQASSLVTLAHDQAEMVSRFKF